jgi:hypothetical protein
VLASCTDDPTRKLYSISGHVNAFVEGRDVNGDSTGFFLVEQPPGIKVVLTHEGAAIDSELTDLGDFRFDYQPDGNYQVLVRQMDTVAVTISGSSVAAPETLEVASFGDIDAEPNPFDLAVRLRFTIADGRVLITIRNAAGDVIRTLVDRTFSAGVHEFIWDAIDDNGDVVAPGLYVVIFEQAGATQAKVLVRCISPTCLGTGPLDVSFRP